MKEKIEGLRSSDKHVFKTLSSECIYVADYADQPEKRKGVEFSDKAFTDINFVQIANKNKIEVYCDAFREHAFQKKKGSHWKQCECALFSTTCEESDWRLFIETKYAKSKHAAFREGNPSHPQKAIAQINETVQFFRDKKLLSTDKKIHAIIAFPNILEDFSAAFEQDDELREKLEEANDNNIVIRPSNYATIDSNAIIHLR
ncbi:MULTISPECIES: hypothetical protein [unclassified Dysgonomonas]|uniref:hypothetical protein n=1 Tax=unclassified Dysgonomonas TaxID=2630389 RepID=UPI0013ECD509|nr:MULTISPECIES: hypothetical protein [unclassified Dysgonomonas]